MDSSPFRVRVDPATLSAVVDGSMIVMDGAMSFFELDAVGAKIWELIRVGADTETIAQSLTSDYQVDLATARADVETFVAQLAAAGLVQSDAPDSAHGSDSRR